MYSNHGNRELQKTIDSHAHVWNHFVALCRRYYGIYGNYPGKKVLIRHPDKSGRLPRFAHADSSSILASRDWNLLPSQSLQDVIQRLDKAYAKMFADSKSGKRSGRPRFKKRFRYKSYTLKQAGWKLLQSNYIRIGKRIYRYFKNDYESPQFFKRGLNAIKSRFHRGCSERHERTVTTHERSKARITESVQDLTLHGNTERLQIKEPTSIGN